MVRAPEDERGIYKYRLGMDEDGGRQAWSLITENNGLLPPVDDHKATSRSHASMHLHDHRQPEQPEVGYALRGKANILSRLASDGSTTSPQARARQHSDMELMKERFAKLLLGEDMSGEGKGVSCALALSNAITNLAASVFGEQKRLEPMSAGAKTRWRKEMDWLLSVTDHIVEFVPSKQTSKDGTNVEIMVTRQRNDLHMNIPALQKLNAMLLDCLDNFKDQNMFYYTSRQDEESPKEKSLRQEDEWWIPTPMVPHNGLSEVTRKWLQHQNDSVNQILKAAMAINSQVLAEMEIPESYIESLPRNGRASLGDSMYKTITDKYFDPDNFLSSVDLSSEHKMVDLKNRLEASIVIWKRKMNAKDIKPSWGSAASLEKIEVIEDRAETILLMLKDRFPGLPQSDLDIAKIQCNRDVGQAILESYSRTIESLAFIVLSRIEDVLHADSLARNPTRAEQKRFFPQPENATEYNSAQTPKLLDFMGWNSNSGEKETKKDCEDEVDKNHISKLAKIVANSRVSYIERLENLGCVWSPTARH